jgi:transcriptional regulator with PAS, ATPase and Fis domain
MLIKTIIAWILTFLTFFTLALIFVLIDTKSIIIDFLFFEYLLIFLLISVVFTVLIKNFFVFDTNKLLLEFIKDWDKIIVNKSFIDNAFSEFDDKNINICINKYLFMKKFANDYIFELQEKINKQTSDLAEIEDVKNNLLNLVAEKTKTIKDMNLNFSKETALKYLFDQRANGTIFLFNSVLKHVDTFGLLVFNNNGEVIKTNKKLSDYFDLPQSVIENDTEEQLIEYFSKQINDKKFTEKYKKCKENELDLGMYSLKNSRKITITYVPYKLHEEYIGKIFIFNFCFKDFSTKK